MPPTSLEELEERLSRHKPAVIDLMRTLPGDIIILGAAGKMGPSLARMAKRASDEAGTKRRVIAVSRFSTPGSAEEFQQHGIETIAVDLLAANAVAYLPHAPNVIYMAGMKFLLLTFTALVLLACEMPTKRAVFGEPGPNAIQVLAGMGFKHHGIYTSRHHKL